MAMATCRECGASVSTSAKVCPRCGVRRPYQPPKQDYRLLGIILVVFLIGLGIFAKFSPSGPSAPPPKQAAPPALTPEEAADKQRLEAEKKRQDTNSAAAFAGAQTLKRAMRDPRSFKLEEALVMRSGAVCYTYRAANGFGGINLERAVLVADHSMMRTSAMSGFTSSWNRLCANKPGTDDAGEIRQMLELLGPRD